MTGLGLLIAACGGVKAANPGDQASHWAPLHLIRMSSGSSCPVTPRTSDKVWDAAFQGALGSGPVYPAGPSIAEGAIKAGRLTRLIWTTASYDGPILIRGVRLDASGSIYMNSRNWWTGPSLVGVEVNSGNQGSGPLVLTVDGTNLYAQLEFPSAGAIKPFEPPGVSPDPSQHTRDWFGEVYVKTAGCYGWQVDGNGFSEEIVFEAV